MIDLNASVVVRAKAVEEIAAAIDVGQKLAEASRAPRTYLGASAIGHPCDRSVQLDYIKANNLPGAPEPVGDGFPPELLRIFDMGHSLEDLAITWLKGAGFDLRTRKADGRQFGFSVADGDFGGHCDGVIVGGKVEMEYPSLFEHKALGRKTWQEMAKKGLAVANPKYAIQVALYQAYLDLPNPALFMATNRDTAEIYLELVNFDASLAQASSDKAVRVITSTRAGELLPKGFAKSDHYECVRCKWRDFCWAEGAQ